MRSVRTADYNVGMYDALTSTYSFSCPARGGSRVALSAFRQLERLPGAAHPAVYPSSFLLLIPGGGSLGLAVRCPECGSVSVNLVTPEHVDVPFWNDPCVGVVEHVFAHDCLRTLDEFRAELYSARFDERRLGLR